MATTHMEGGESVKRPMNAFMLWSKQKRRDISKCDPTLHNAQISKLLGEEWRVLSLEEKLPFIEESQKLMVKHKEEHPNYRYKPRQSKIVKPNKPYPAFAQRKERSQYYQSYTCPYPPSAMDAEDNRDVPYYPVAYRHRPYSYAPRHHPPPRYELCGMPGCFDCHYNRSLYRYHTGTGRCDYRLSPDQQSISPVPSSCNCCNGRSRPPSVDFGRDSPLNGVSAKESSSQPSLNPPRSKTDFSVAAIISPPTSVEQPEPQNKRVAKASTSGSNTSSDSNDESYL